MQWGTCMHDRGPIRPACRPRERRRSAVVSLAVATALCAWAPPAWANNADTRPEPIGGGRVFGSGDDPRVRPSGEALGGGLPTDLESAIDVVAAPRPFGAVAPVGAVRVSGISDTIVLPLHTQIIPIRHPGHKLGEWTLWGFASEKVVRDDNVFLESRDEERATFFDTTLGGRIAREGAEFQADVVAALTESFSARESGLDQTAYYVRGGARWDVGAATHVRLTQLVSRQTSARQRSAGRDVDEVLIAQRRVRQFVSATGLTLGHDWEKTGAQLEYRFRLVDHSRRLAQLDGREHQVTGTVRHELSPKVTVNAQLRYREDEFRRSINNDSDSLGGFAGGAWEPTPKLRFSGRVGYVSQHISSTGSVADRDEFSGPGGRLTAAWEASKKTTFDLVFERDYFPGSRSNFQAVTLLAGGVKIAMSPLWTAGARLSRQTSNPSNSARFESTSIDLVLAYDVNPTTQIELSYRHDDRDTEGGGRDFDQNQFALSLSYRF